jgi:3-dehydroquinate dehydratase-1
MTTASSTGIRGLLAEGVPLIAASFTDRTSDGDLALSRKEGLDIAEVRIDRFSTREVDQVVREVKRFAKFPTIGTIRIAAEGGEWTGSETERLALFEAIAPEVDAIDIELAASEIRDKVIRLAKDHGKAVIVSHHDFLSTPTAIELVAMTDQAKAAGADLVKLSMTAQTAEDVRRLASFTIENCRKGLIVIAMGPLGSVSRVFFPALGSRITYAFVDGQPISGQLRFTDTFDELRRFYPAFNDKKIRELEILDGA